MLNDKTINRLLGKHARGKKLTRKEKGMLRKDYCERKLLLEKLKLCVGSNKTKKCKEYVPTVSGNCWVCGKKKHK